MNSISDRVLRLREEKKFSRKDLAELAEISQPTIYNIENGKTHNITFSVGKKIAKALGVSFGELFEIEGPVGSVDESLLNEKNANIADLQKQIEQKDKLIELLGKENWEFIDEVAFLHNYIETLFNQLIKLAENDRDRKRDEAVKELLQKYIFSLTIKVPDSFNRFKRINEYWKKINEADNFDLNEYVNQ